MINIDRGFEDRISLFGLGGWQFVCVAGAVIFYFSWLAMRFSWGLLFEGGIGVGIVYFIGYKITNYRKPINKIVLKRKEDVFKNVKVGRN
ncbi:MAG: hypothetical protein QM528_02835 [Phycisphaerales bacterium]|nr:hypothetical protein [Phycisphaerales bacterium]